MTELAIAVGVILFPGIIATTIADKIVVHVRPWGPLKYGLYSFILGVFSYLGLQCLSWLQMMVPTKYQITPLLGSLDAWNIIGNTKARIDFAEVAGATLLSLPVAFIAAFTINHKVVHKLAKKLGVSIKYGDENLYSFYLNAQEIDWVYVRDVERKLTYQGRVFSFSENDKFQELVLSDVTVFGYENSDEYYSVPSIYLCRTAGSFVIESVPPHLLEKANGKKTA